LNFRFLLSGLFFSIVLNLGAQETSGSFFDKVSENYGRIKDYTAQIIITRYTDEEVPIVERGTIYYKNPEFIRIDYDIPENQVLVVDSEYLTLYLPEFKVLMKQKLARVGDSLNSAGLATAQGLFLMKRNYGSAYENGNPNPQLLDENSQERVTKLRLTGQLVDEGFRQLVLSINSDKTIRRIIGIRNDLSIIQFDFLSIVTNTDIPDTRFEFQAPSNANVYENFLFDPEG